MRTCELCSKPRHVGKLCSEAPTVQQVQIESGPRPGYCSCGEPLVQTARASMSSPAEYGCAVCDGGHAPGERPYPADADDVAYERARARGWPD